MKHLPIKEAHFLIIIAGLLVSIGIAWGINTVKVEKHEVAISEYINVEKRVLTMETENKARDEIIELITEYIEADRKWKLKDAEWKGGATKLFGQNIFYGSLQDIENLKKILGDTELPKKGEHE